MSAVAPRAFEAAARAPAPPRAGRHVAGASILLALGTLFPISSVALACYSKNLLRSGSRGTFLFYACFLALMLALLNAGKLIEADEKTYLDFLTDMSRNIQNGFSQAVLDATGRRELGFYAISYPLFRLTGGSIKSVIVFWTFWIYFLSALAFARLFRDRIAREYSLAIFAICSMVFINFILTAQVTRQYAAGAMILVSFAYFDRRFLSFGLLVFASLVHNAGAVFLVPWLFALFFGARFKSMPPSWLVLGLLAGLFAAGSVAFSIVEYLTGGLLAWFAGSLLDNGEVSIFKLVTLGAAFAILYYEMTRNYDRRLVPFAIALLFLTGLLALVWKLPLFILRFSFFVEFFATISVAMLFFRFAPQLPRATVLLLPLLANAALLTRVLNSPWTYSWLEKGLVDNFVGNLMVRAFSL
jgi:hypothetical protein